MNCRVVYGVPRTPATHLHELENHPALQFPLIHFLKHSCQLAHLLHPYVTLDDASGSKIQRLDCVPAIPHGRAADGELIGNHNSRAGRGNSNGRMLRQAHAHQGAVEAQKAESLGIRLVRGGAGNDGVGAQAAAQLLDVRGDSGARVVVVLAELGKVDKVLSARGTHQVGFARVVDADDAQAHAAAGELHGEVTQAASRSGHDYPLAGSCLASPQGSVDGHASAEQGSCLGRVELLGNTGHVVRRAGDVLLKRSGRVVSGDLLVKAEAV